MKTEEAFLFGGLTAIIVMAIVAAIRYLSKPEKRMQIDEVHSELTQNHFEDATTGY